MSSSDGGGRGDGARPAKDEEQGARSVFIPMTLRARRDQVNEISQYDVDGRHNRSITISVVVLFMVSILITTGKTS